MKKALQRRRLATGIAVGTVISSSIFFGLTGIASAQGSKDPSALSAGTATEHDSGTTLAISNLNGNLIDGLTGHGISGATIVFSGLGQTLCTAVTDSHGNASCNATITGNSLTILLDELNLSSNGYVATFNGNSQYYAAPQAGGRVTIN